MSSGWKFLAHSLFPLLGLALTSDGPIFEEVPTVEVVLIVGNCRTSDVVHCVAVTACAASEVVGAASAAVVMRILTIDVISGTPFLVFACFHHEYTVNHRDGS